MSMIQTTVEPSASPSAVGLVGWVKRHPLVAYFVLAYAITWILIVPILLSQRGFGLLALPDVLLLVFFIVSTFAGPFGAALIVTGVTEGRAGVRLLLRRIVQWRVGLLWYLIPILGYPLLFVVAYSFVLGTEPITAFIQKWPLFLTSYLPAILYGMILPSLGEEPGWRGFALPRLQLRYGALVGTLILGTLHAFWHFPVYFVPGAILPGPFDLTAFIANSFAIIAETVLWTWIFNNARGSILIAMLFHGASNAFSGYFPQLLTVPDDPWATFKVFAVSALLVIVFTRGRLAYNPNQVTLTAIAPQPQS